MKYQVSYTVLRGPMSVTASYETETDKPLTILDFVLKSLKPDEKFIGFTLYSKWEKENNPWPQLDHKTEK